MIKHINIFSQVQQEHHFHIVFILPYYNTFIENIVLRKKTIKAFSDCLIFF